MSGRDDQSMAIWCAGPQDPRSRCGTGAVRTLIRWAGTTLTARASRYAASVARAWKEYAQRL
jgi:hypothetical protein